MKLLENIYGTKTSAETVATVMKLGKTIRKVTIVEKYKNTVQPMNNDHPRETRESVLMPRFNYSVKSRYGSSLDIFMRRLVFLRK